MDGMIKLATLEDFIGPPPAGVAPLDTFRDALLARGPAEGGDASREFDLSRTNAELLRYYRHEKGFGFHEARICEMVRKGWEEDDAAVAVLGLWYAPCKGGAASGSRIPRRSRIPQQCRGASRKRARNRNPLGTDRPRRRQPLTIHPHQNPSRRLPTSSFTRRCVATAIGASVRAREPRLASISHAVAGAIGSAGAHMPKPAPDLYLAARGSASLPYGLFDWEPSAAAALDPGGEMQ